eukprot:172000_1
MTASNKPNKWIHSASPFDDSNNECYIGNITCVNAHEFIISTSDSNKQLFKYNIDTNTFNELCIDDSNWNCGKMDFNNKQQILYIQNRTKIISIDMKTNSCDTLLGANYKYGNYIL